MRICKINGKKVVKRGESEEAILPDMLQKQFSLKEFIGTFLPYDLFGIVQFRYLCS